MDQFLIEQWDAAHPRWIDLVQVIQQQDLSSGVLQQSFPLDSAVYLSAHTEQDVVGLLMMLIQPIGPEMDCPPLCDRQGRQLLEAKVRAFHVHESYRNQGIGTALQQAAIRTAAKAGCYQIRSWSAYTRESNYAIKLKLGFVAHPGTRRIQGLTVPGIYWVKRVEVPSDGSALHQQ